MNDKIKRNVLLNPGPGTTTDSVKYAQVVPDICPRENEFTAIMESISLDMLKIIHADPEDFTSVLYCGSGTVCIDACISSLVPDDKRILVINNGAYSKRAVDVCKSYNVPYFDLALPIDEPADLAMIEKILSENTDIAAVYACHHETGTGLLNPIKEIGALAHKFNSIFIVDTISTYAMLPIHMENDNLDFIMASAQKGLMAMTGLSFVIGRKKTIEASKDHQVRSYYVNMYMQYKYALENSGQMRFTPPVQTVYSVKQALKEYWQEGEEKKWKRHTAVWESLYDNMKELGFDLPIKKEYQSQLVLSITYPDDPNWDFNKVHDYCYERGFTIYPGKIPGLNTFRLCSYGVIDVKDIEKFLNVFREILKVLSII